MSKANQNPHHPETVDDAVSLFTQFTSQSDSASDLASANSTHDLSAADKLSEQLDSEDEHSPTGTEVKQGLERADDGQEADAEEDPWVNAPESLRNEYMNLRQNHDKLSNEHRANSGRVAALNRELASLRQQMSANEAVGGQREIPATQPSADALKDKSFEQVEEEWPEIAAYLKHMVEQSNARIEQKLTPVEAWQQQLDSERQQQALQHEYDKLAQSHPDYQQVASDPNFHQWLQGQPPSIKAMSDSQLADDNIVLLNLFKGSVQSSPSAKPPTEPARPALSDHAEIPRKGAGRASTSHDDADPVQLFNQLVQRTS